MKSGIFVSGTDTGVGKTVVSSLLVTAFQAHEVRTGYFKPIQTGLDLDTDSVSHLTSLPISDFPPPAYQLAPPMAPYRAALLENTEIDLDHVVQKWQDLGDQLWIVEGAGGLLVPLTEKQTTRELIQKLGLKMLLVASTRLGTLNHTLMTLEVAQAAGIEVLGMILVGEEDAGLDATLAKFSRVPILARIPQFQEVSPNVIANAGREFFSPGVVKRLAEAAGFFGDPSTPKATFSSISLPERDRKVIWHPYSQHGLNREILPVVAGRGAYLKLVDQREILDAISSWWVNIHGHGFGPISDILSIQAQTLEHVIFSGFTHEPAVKLAELLTQYPAIQAAQLTRVFYSDNGSTAVEAAMKMAFQFYLNRGIQTRTRFLALRHSYHGDTIGAMAVGEPEGFHSQFRKLMPPVDFVDAGDLIQLRELLTTRADTYAAFIFEPLVQGASGMRMYSAEYLKEAVRLCQDHDIVTICDEVFTGFFRTGKAFAFEHAEIQPDLVCISKGITGGFLPLAATLTTERIFSAFVSKEIRTAFLHGHSYTANPVACAAAIESWKVLFTPESQGRIQAIVAQTTYWIDRLKHHPQVYAARCLGTIGAIEVKGELNYYSSETNAFFQFALERGVLLRPLGNVVYAVPPYCCSPSEVDRIYQVMEDLLNSVSKEIK